MKLILLAETDDVIPAVTAAAPSFDLEDLDELLLQEVRSDVTDAVAASSVDLGDLDELLLKDQHHVHNETPELVAQNDARVPAVPEENCFDAPAQHDVFEEPGRKRGRPKGSVRWPAASKAALERAGVSVNVTAAREAPQPGDIAYARLARHVKHHGAQEYTRLPEGERSAVSVSGTVATSWAELLCGIGDKIQRCIASAFVWHSQQKLPEQKEAESAESRSLLARLLQKSRTHGSVQSLMDTLGGDAKLNTTSRQLLRTGCAVVQGASLWWGAFLSASQSAAQRAQGQGKSSWKPLLFISKLMYDETPMRFRVPVKSDTTREAATIVDTEHTDSAKVSKLLVVRPCLWLTAYESGHNYNVCIQPWKYRPHTLD